VAAAPAKIWAWPISRDDVGVAEALLHIHIIVSHAPTMCGVVLPDIPV
jgi:hypothetical protein